MLSLPWWLINYTVSSIFCIYKDSILSTNVVDWFFRRTFSISKEYFYFITVILSVTLSSTHVVNAGRWFHGALLHFEKHTSCRIMKKVDFEEFALYSFAIWIKEIFKYFTLSSFLKNQVKNNSWHEQSMRVVHICRVQIYFLTCYKHSYILQSLFSLNIWPKPFEITQYFFYFMRNKYAR